MCLVAQSSDRTKSSGIMDEIGVAQSMSLYSDDLAIRRDKAAAVNDLVVLPA